MNVFTTTLLLLLKGKSAACASKSSALVSGSGAMLFSISRSVELAGMVLSGVFVVVVDCFVAELLRCEALSSFFSRATFEDNGVFSSSVILSRSIVLAYADPSYS